jgi:hypothetical protein
LGGGHGNPLGHWEPARLLEINEEILSTLGRTWHDPRPISPSWFRSKAAYKFQQRIVDEIALSYGNAPLIVIKEPRICRLAPLYLDALDILEIEPLVVLLVRHPAEVIRSIHDRDGGDLRSHEFVWLRHFMEAEDASRATTRVWISFDHVLGDWGRTVNAISSQLGITWRTEPDKAASRVSAILRGRQRHYQVTNDPASLPLGSLTTRAWQAARHALNGDEKWARAELDEIRTAVDELDRLSLPQWEGMEKRLAESDAEISSLRSALSAVYTSRSWRLTAPVRAIKTIFARPGGSSFTPPGQHPRNRRDPTTNC